ncbi:MAG: MBL fold metallo-hydrolase [Chlorobiaceae bacterium]|nr:MBL fold metallo-hydrolase [Chlorobiaceae bacterium]MBA4309707.1 MBL fold metallo-hydrolase [Chlorobiaceae bacterium]
MENLIDNYPLVWKKKNFSIKIFCSIPNIATGILLSASNKYFLVDPGDGMLRDLDIELSQKKIKSINNIFITHGHHDHVGGVWSLLTYLKVVRKKSALNIHYPTGCVEIESIIKAFCSVYDLTIPYKINLKPISTNKKFVADTMSVIPFEVIHHEHKMSGTKTQRVPALGYKFIYEGKSICYGGDTAYCDSLAEMAKDSDLAIIEAGNKNEKESEMHMSQLQAAAVGNLAKKYFLVHVPK